MKNLINFFKNLLVYKKAIASEITGAAKNEEREGAELERVIGQALEEEGIKAESSDDELINKASKKIEAKVQSSLTEFIKNEGILEGTEYEGKTFSVYQPYGKQQYPDYLVFTPERVVPLEVKYRKGNAPMWNGSYPKRGGIYIFAAGKKKDLTVFCGKDIISKKLALKFELCVQIQKYLNIFFKEVLNIEENIIGAYLSGRISFLQKKFNKTTIVDFINNSKRDEWEQNVLKELERKEKSEEKDIDEKINPKEMCEKLFKCFSNIASDLFGLTSKEEFEIHIERVELTSEEMLNTVIEKSGLTSKEVLNTVTEKLGLTPEEMINIIKEHEREEKKGEEKGNDKAENLVFFCSKLLTIYGKPYII